ARLLSERFSSTTGKLAKHVLQDAAVAVVVGLTGCVDADHTVEVDAGAVVLRRRDLDSGRGRALVELRDTFDGEGLGAVETERLSRLAGGELQRQDAHADEVRAVDALEALRDDGDDTEQRRAPAGPGTRGSRAVLLATEDDQRDAGGPVVHRGVVDRRLRTVLLREVAGEATLDSVEELVLQADVRERSADHEFVVAAALAVGGEVTALHTVLAEVLAGLCVGVVGTSRRDGVSGNRVAGLGEHTGALDVLDALGLEPHAVEEGGLAHVGRVGVPLEDLAFGGVELLPTLVTV